jgi:hypothetical protein
MLMLLCVSLSWFLSAAALHALRIISHSQLTAPVPVLDDPKISRGAE